MTQRMVTGDLMELLFAGEFFFAKSFKEAVNSLAIVLE